MEIIDFHAHIYPEKIASKAVEGIGNFYNISMSGDGTLKALVASGEANGVTGYVVHSVATTESQVVTINNFIAGECGEKRRALYGFGTMHAAFKDPEKEIDRIIGLGLKGIKLHPDTQHFNIDDPRMLDIYEILQSKKLPVLFHTGDYRYDFSHPSRLAKVLDSFKQLTVIAAHFGGWSLYDLALEFFKDRSCYVDTSSSMAYLGRVRTKELINIYGAERVLFGSDFPMWSYEDELTRINELKLTDREYELIMAGNAKRILSITE